MLPGAAAFAVPAGNPAPVGEVVVTARKIREDVQNVPMSLQVLTADRLDETGTRRWYELQFSVPGLVINNTGFNGVGFSLRGVADQRVNGLSVAPHLNGVYLGDANVAVARLFDVERIEVLKGPQGTLYGRNATGGSVNVITAAPQATFDAALEVARSSFDTTRAQGHLDLPASRVATRFSFIASEGDGYVRNSVDDRRFAEDDYWGLRASLSFDAGEKLRVNAMAQRVRDDGGAGDLWTPPPPFLADPRDIRLATVVFDDPYLVSEVDNFNVSLEYALGFATLHSVTGYARSRVRNVDDCSGAPFLPGCVRSALPSAFDTWSQELQLVFPRRGNVDGLIGAYYAEAHADLDFSLLLPSVGPQPVNDYHWTSRDPSAAVFGQATLHLSDAWSATAGLRYTREEHRITTIGAGTADSPVLVASALDSDEPSWLLNVSYAPREGLLLYAGISTGYKSGGFDSGSLIEGRPDAYGPEYLTAYEAGLKRRGPNGRLAIDAAVFLYDYRDLQVNTEVFVGGIPTFNIDNAARAELYGIDAVVDFAVSPHWSVSGGVVWVPKREFVEYRNELTGDTLSGNDLVRAPEWSATGAVDYEFELRGAGSLSVRVEYSYRSSFYYTAENTRLFAQDSFGLLNAHVRFEASKGDWYLFASGRNLTDEDYFNQVFLQSSPGYPDTYEVGAGFRF